MKKFDRVLVTFIDEKAEVAVAYELNPFKHYLKIDKKNKIKFALTGDFKKVHVYSNKFWRNLLQLFFG